MKVYLSSGKTKMQLPVIPEEYKFSESMDHVTENIVKYGEVLLPGDKKLVTFSLSAHFPNQKRAYCQCTPKKPMWYIKQLRSWKSNKSIVVVQITGKRTMNCLISELEWGEQDGSGDIYYTISFVENKDIYKTKKKIVKSTSTTSKKKTSSSAKKATKTYYIIKKGDTLPKIAKLKLGNSKYWTQIYRNNKSVIEAAAKKHKKNLVPMGTGFTLEQN